MNPDEPTLEIFLRDRMKEKGISLKKLSDATGISINHIENMLRGDFESVPATPYFRGYLIRLGQELDFTARPGGKRSSRKKRSESRGRTTRCPKIVSYAASRPRRWSRSS